MGEGRLFVEPAERAACASHSIKSPLQVYTATSSAVHLRSVRTCKQLHVQKRTRKKADAI